MHYRKRIYLVVVVVSILIIMFFYYSNKYNNPSTNIAPRNLTSESIQQLSKSTYNQEILYDNYLSLASSEITQVSYEQDIIYNNSGSLGVFYNDLKSNLLTNITKENKIEDLLSQLGDVSIQEKEFKITVFEKDGKSPIQGVSVYLRGNLLGVSDENGIVSKTLNIPKYFNYYYFQANKKGYGWGFKKRSDMYYSGYEVYDNIVLHDKAETVKSDTSNFKIQTKDVELESSGDCILLDNSGKCYSGEFTVDLKRLRGDQVDDAAMYMEALMPDGTFTNLISNGMAFLVFYDNNNIRLIYNNDKVSKICYNIRSEDIEGRNNRETQLDNVEGYWWFDIKSGYWHFDKEANIELIGNKWCVETKYIY
ncbi:MAG: hypothetical protein V3575_03785 [Candidatus Absconditabacteria bacterium]